MELLQFFKGFIRNYATLLIFEDDSATKVTAREVGYFSKLGEMLGFHVFQEDTVEIEGKKKKGDLFWTRFDPKEEEFIYKLHLEHENSLLAEETIRTKLSDTPNLVAICWDTSDNYDELIEHSKEKIKKNEDIENILLIIQRNLNECTFVTGIEISKINNDFRVKECQGLITTNDAGFFYGLLKEEIEEWKWMKYIN